MTDDIEDHGLRYLFFPLVAAKLGLQMKFFLEEIGFPSPVPATSRRVPSAARIWKIALRPAICTSTPAMRCCVFRFELFRDPQQGRQQPSLPPPLAIERRVGCVLHLRLRFRIVVAHERRDHVAPPAAQARDFAVANQIFPVAMMRFVADGIAHVVQQRSNFQNEPQVRSISWSGRS